MTPISFFVDNRCTVMVHCHPPVSTQHTRPGPSSFHIEGYHVLWVATNWLEWHCMFKRDTNSGSDNDTAPLMSSKKGAGASEDPFYAVREYVDQFVYIRGPFLPIK